MHWPSWLGSLAVCQGDKLAAVDEGKRFRAVAALKVDRLVVSAVDMHHLARIKAHTKPRGCGHAGVGIRFYRRPPR
jgi:hypothetical protein